MKTKKIAVMCHKGGVGKTVTVAGLADAISFNDPTKKILILDGDEQNCQRTIFGVKLTDTRGGLSSLLDGTLSLSDARVKVRPNIDLVLSGGRELREFESRNSCVDNAEMLLRTNIGDVSEYDYILMDCPPAISLVSANAITFCDYILIPCLPELLAFVGCKQTNNFIEQMGKHYAEARYPVAKVLGVVLTQYCATQNLDQSIFSDLEDLAEKRLIGKCFSPIPKDVKVKTAQVKRKLLSEGFAKCKAAAAYRLLAKELQDEIEKIVNVTG
jgi:chromosome partitioning protein